MIPLFFFFCSVEDFLLKSWLNSRPPPSPPPFSMVLYIRNKEFYCRSCCCWDLLGDWIALGMLFLFGLSCPLIHLNGALGYRMVLSEFISIVSQLHCWDTLLIVVWKVNRGKGLFGRSHHLVNTSCHFWDSGGAFWLTGVRQTSFWGCQNWFGKERHSSGAENKTVGLQITSQTLSREKVIASKGVSENKVDPVTHRNRLKQPGPAWAAVQDHRGFGGMDICLEVLFSLCLLKVSGSDLQVDKSLGWREVVTLQDVLLCGT